jgi:hypothetical protein
MFVFMIDSDSPHIYSRCIMLFIILHKIGHIGEKLQANL